MPLWGDTDAEAPRPKFVPAALQDNLVFIDREEASTLVAKEKGMSTAGWYLYRTFTDVGGATRHKAELLIALSRSGADAGDDDAIFGIVITAQPADESVTEGGTATFSITVTPDSEAVEFLTYQWQRAEPGTTTFSSIVETNSSTYETDVTVLADNGALYRCIVETVSGNAGPVYSESATLTVTELT